MLGPCLLLALFLCADAFGAPSSLAPADTLAVRLAPGFKITQFAGQDLASDIFSMTLDAQGRVVVSGPGYIKRLEDTNGDGKADKATLFAVVKTGAQGMCFDGNDLYFFGDGTFGKFVDTTGDGVADGNAIRLGTFANPEHGVHAMRKGPDGWWYLIGGNDSGFQRQQITLPNSPVLQPEGGALLRYTPDARSLDMLAHGFRNPYDFDFNDLGDVFTYDSDVESDLFLPWYTPTRLYHIAFGGHHGWRLNGWKRSWNRPSYYADTVDALAFLGRGSPTGVTCYRHHRFPEKYRNGIFLLDWTFGRIHFYTLTPSGSSYSVEPEVFLEPTGIQGFAPTDVVVAPDGSLFVSIGGRKTRGAVYRIDSINPRMQAATNQPGVNELIQVLQAPQPLDAWSRARWVPIARKLGAQVFQDAVASARFKEEEKIRAIEILTELFSGLSPVAARDASKSSSPFVRARVAWSLGRVSGKGLEKMLLPLAGDASPIVRRQAMEALVERVAQVNPAEIVPIVAANLGHEDKRVWQVAALLASRLPEREWLRLQAVTQNGRPSVLIGAAMASMWRNTQEIIHDAAAATGLQALLNSPEPDLQLEALRVIMVALGDHNIQRPSVEVYSAYEFPQTLAGRDALVEQIKAAVRGFVSSKDAEVRLEATRLLAMLEDEDPEVRDAVLGLITDESNATVDFHHLIVLSRLRAPATPEFTKKVAHHLLSLDRKLSGQQLRNKQNWNLRLVELVGQFIRRDPQLAVEMLRHPNFSSSGHIHLVSVLTPQQRISAARIFLAAVQRNRNFPWSGALVGILAQLPPHEVRPLLRAQWGNFGIRDEILLTLAARPEVIDRDKYLHGLNSAQLQVVRSSATALTSLPRDVSPTNLVPVFRALQRLYLEPKQGALRTQLLGLISRQSGQSFNIKDVEADPATLQKSYEPAVDWFRATYPMLAAALHDDGEEDPLKWKETFSKVSWARGRPDRGEKIFNDRACQTCHLAENALGPNLSGTGRRFSAEDLFMHIAMPNREIAAPYRTTVFQTKDGQNLNGIVVFEAADGVILQTGSDSTLRLEETNIVSRRPGNISLMPTGLLNGLKPEELADLHAYLKNLVSTTPGR